MKKINEKINELKNNKDILISYVKCICDDAKLEKLLSSKEEYKELKEFLKRKKVSN